MKIVVRALVLGVFVAGASAAVVSSHPSNVATATPSHQATVAMNPIPACYPNACTTK